MTVNGQTGTKVRRSKFRIRSWVLRLVYVLVTFSIIIGLSARYLPPEAFWWTGLFAPPLPFLSAFLILTSPLFFWRYRSFGRTSIGLLLFLIILRFVPFRMFIENDKPRPDDLTVMTFNSPVRGPNPVALSGSMLTLVRKENPDLVALQEPVVWLDYGPVTRRATGHLQVLLDSLSYWTPSPLRKGKQFDLNQPVISKFKFEEVKQITLAGTVTSEPTYITRSLFRWQGRQVVIYNMHLHTVGEKKPWHEQKPEWFDLRFWQPYLDRFRNAVYRRSGEVREIRKMLASETLPVIVVGDMNSTVHHWEYHEIAKGLINAFTNRGKSWGATYHSRLPLVRIDHILVSPDWEVVSTHVSREHAYSDHLPVIARIRLKETG